METHQTPQPEEQGLDLPHSQEDIATAAPKVPKKQLLVKEVVKRYRGRAVVDHVTIELYPGEIVGLLGPNGAGKTTTFYMTIGLVSPDEGHIYLNGEDITRLPIYQRARLGIGYLAQEPSVFRKLTVADNIRLVWEARGIPRREQEGRLKELLSEFGIWHLRNAPAYVLSGGERRRVEVARALANDPAFIMLDEPFTGIDPITIESLEEIIVGLKERGLGVLVTDHNVQATLPICDRAYIMVDGQVLVSGHPEEIAENELARKYFLGQRFRLERSPHTRTVMMRTEPPPGGESSPQEPPA